MSSFYFYHYSKQLTGSLPSSVSVEMQNIAVWETCLRKIIFAENADPIFTSQKNHLELFEDENALIFILEVLCGLQSKVIGETEIFGQFKNFIETEQAQKISFFKNKQFVQFLFQQVKEIRDKYITQLGVNSYGSMIRKICQNENQISLIGYGQLAQKILPWISSNRKIKIHVRDKSKYQNQENVEFLNLFEKDFFSTVIVAAPLKTENLTSLIDLVKAVYKIVDCRSIEGQDRSIKNTSLVHNAEIVDLNDLFANAEAKQQKMQTLLPVIQQEIKNRVQAYIMKSHHRPQGWEDLCG